MKNLLLIPVFLVLAAVGVYVAPLLFAQAPNPPRATRVAVVNVRAVLKENRRAKALQAELEETLKPYKLQAERLTREIDAQTFSKTPNLALKAKKQAEWDAVNAQILQIIEEKHKQKMPEVWNEVNRAIEAVAKHYDFHIVLGYGDPETSEVNAFQVKTTKYRAAEMGCTAAVCLHDSIDITRVVILTLAQIKN